MGRALKIRPRIEELKELPHEKRARSRKAKRKEERAAREWSPERPKPEEFDYASEFLMLANRLTTMNGSVWHKANTTGLSTTTIYNWKSREKYGNRPKVRSPNLRTFKMALRAIGGRMMIVFDGEPTAGGRKKVR